jgi:hypothetical protein
LYFRGKNPQALVSFKKYMPPPPLLFLSKEEEGAYIF